MAMFDFGVPKKVLDRAGNEKEVGEFALHVQCAWRMARRNQILVTSRDIHYSADYSEDQDIPDEFDWDREPNRLDKLLHSLFEQETNDFVVQKVEVGDAGKLHLLLGNDASLELFPDDSLAGERWRLFIPGAHQPHLVVTGR